MDIYKRRKIDAHVDMTPMVDTLLQLFMIFLFGATFISSSVNLDLPKGSVEKQSSIQEITVSIDAKNNMSLNKQPILRNELMVKLRSLLRQAKEPVVMLLADRSLSYEQVLEVIIQIQETGGTKVALAYNPDQKPQIKDKKLR